MVYLESDWLGSGSIFITCWLCVFLWASCLTSLFLYGQNKDINNTYSKNGVLLELLFVKDFKSLPGS